MKTFNTQVCTNIEQSERLLALGLKKENADMVYTNASLPYNKDVFHVICKEYSQLNKEVNYEISPFSFIPAWSLHRLIAMLPKYCKREYYLSIQGNDIHYELIGSTEYGISHYSFCKKGNIYENIIDCIEWLTKNKILNKEYLEE